MGQKRRSSFLRKTAIYSERRRKRRLQEEAAAIERRNLISWRDDECEQGFEIDSLGNGSSGWHRVRVRRTKGVVVCTLADFEALGCPMYVSV